MNEARYRDVERRLWESLGLRPIERHVRLSRLQTTARLQEVGDGPTILFVHGGSASGEHVGGEHLGVPSAVYCSTLARVRARPLDRRS